MPKNTTILMIRHGEKPETGTGLAPAGQMRAQAYSIYFQNYALKGKNLKFSYLFASQDSQKSDRLLLTITPFSKAVGLPINHKHADSDYQKLADDLLQHPKYDNSNMLICWHHGKILDFANALGVNPASLPASATWPSKWPGSVFGWLLQLVYDANGNLVPDQTFCVSEKLMYDDYGQVPPGPEAQ